MRLPLCACGLQAGRSPVKDIGRGDERRLPLCILVHRWVRVRKLAQGTSCFNDRVLNTLGSFFCLGGMPDRRLNGLQLLELGTRAEPFEVAQAPTNLFQLTTDPVCLLRFGELFR